jgi:hypothetical protein
MEYIESFKPENVSWECGALNLTKDNIFANDFTGTGCVPTNAGGSPQNFAGGDTWLGICPNATSQFLSIPVYDPLSP